MPTTSNIGLHIYNDIELSSAFSTVRDWRQSFQGNNASESASDMQIIDAAFGSVFSSMSAITSSIASMSSAICSMSSSIDTLSSSIIFLSSSKQDKLLVFTNKTADIWTADNTYQGFSYRCDINCPGVTIDTVIDVIFSLDEAISGDYAPICQTTADTVTIYAKVSTAITIPTIKEV